MALETAGESSDSIESLSLGDLVMTWRLSSTCWAVRTILLSVTLLGIKGAGMIAARAAASDQSQDATTGSVKTAEEDRALVEELRVLAQAQRAQLQKTEAALVRAQASVKRQSPEERERRERVKALMEELRKGQESLERLKRSLKTSGDPAIRALKKEVDKIRAELVHESRAKEKQLVQENRAEKVAAAATELKGRYYALIGGDGPTILVLVDAFTGQCWTHVVGAEVGTWTDLGTPNPLTK